MATLSVKKAELVFSIDFVYHIPQGNNFWKNKTAWNVLWCTLHFYWSVFSVFAPYVNVHICMCNIVYISIRCSSQVAPGIWIICCVFMLSLNYFPMIKNNHSHEWFASRSFKRYLSTIGIYSFINPRYFSGKYFNLEPCVQNWDVHFFWGKGSFLRSFPCMGLSSNSKRDLQFYLGSPHITP